MGKKKTRLSLFSTLIQQINEPSNDYHLVDQEYFAAFDSLNDIERFHQQLREKQSTVHVEEEEEEEDLPIEEEIDMKSFAQQYLVDLPEDLQSSSQELFSSEQPINWSPKMKTSSNMTSSTESKKRKSKTPVKVNVEINSKRQRRNIRDLPQSSEFIFASNKEARKSINPLKTVVDSSQDEPSSTAPSENSLSHDVTKTVTVKAEPIDSEQFVAESLQLNMDAANPMDFGTSKYSGHLDNYVQNIHLLHQPSSPSPTSSRPKRIRKRKIFFSEESETINRPKKFKSVLQKTRPSAPPPLVPLTDAEIEQQFGERLPVIKTEHHEDLQPIIPTQTRIEYEPIPRTPIEKARAKLTTALGRGHDPDTYLLKIRSRENKIIEINLEIYSTADWYYHRGKILSRIEEALRGLRVSWNKIDIRVDDFDIQVSTLSQTSTVSPPTTVTNNNSSWFLKLLSESGPLIVHIHDRKHPQQRLLIKCSCPECSPLSPERSFNSSLPVLVNSSPATTPTRRLVPPTILNKPQQNNISSLHNIATTFFNELIYRWGRTTVISVTQCVLDLALIVSVHASLSSLSVAPNFSNEEYKKKYQQIIDPLKCTSNETEEMSSSKTPMLPPIVSANTQTMIRSKPPDILAFYNSIKVNQANIRSAKSMRNLIATLIPPSVTSLPRTLILPKPIVSITPSHSQTELMVRNSVDSTHSSIRRLSQINQYDKHHEMKQQAHCTPIIELQPILVGPPIMTQKNEVRKNTILEVSDKNYDIPPSATNSARVIRLSIGKSALSTTSPSTIRLISSPKTDSDQISILSTNKGETVPLVPKQINIIKPLSSSASTIAPAIKLSNPVLITTKSQPPSTK